MSELASESVSTDPSAGGAPVSNPPGLTRIAYRAGDFATFRRALLTPLANEQELVNWSPGTGDLGLQALEWWAYLADILTFYNERIANGSYLGTAVAQPGPQNAAGIAMLLGYLSTPAITATGVVAAIRGAAAPGGPLVIPAGLQIASTPTADAPAQLFEVTEGRTFTGPSDAVIGLPADPALFLPGPAQSPAPGATQQVVLLNGQVTVSAGDQFVLLNRGWDGTRADWAVVTARSAAAEKAPDGRVNTRLTLSSADWHGLGPADPAVGPPSPPGAPGPGAAPPGAPGASSPGAGYSNTGPSSLRSSNTGPSSPDSSNTGLSNTGLSNAGLSNTGPLAADYQLQRAPATAPLWTMGAAVGGPSAVPTAQPPVGGPSAGPAPQTLTVPLATLVRNLSPGDNVLFTGSPVLAGASGGAAAPAIALLAQVTGYTEEITQVPVVAAPTTRTGTQPNAYVSHTFLTVRTAGADRDVAALRSVLGTPALGGIVLRYGFRDVGTPVPAPAAALDRLPVGVTIPSDQPLPDGPVALADANGAGLLVTATADGPPGNVTLAAADGGPRALSPALRAPIRLLADLVPVSRGTTVDAETLGDGDPAAAGQTFALQHSPLIYLPPAEPGGDPVSTLSVSVNGIPWREVRAFTGERGDATVYAVSQFPDGSVQIRFGDGTNGARLPLGSRNVTAAYRYGPVAPPPPAGSLATVLQPQPNLGRVLNPVDITPGTEAETAGETAAAAPATVVLLPGATSVSPPLISLADGERLAARVTGVTRVRAYWTWDPRLHRPALTVYVASDIDPAAAVTAVSGIFSQARSRVPLSAAPARGVGLAVGCRLLGAPGASEDTVRTAATEALTGSNGLFSPGRMGIGQRLYRSQVEGALTAGGVAVVLGLSVRRPGEDDPPGRSVLDPGQDGYFSLSAADLSISVVTR